MSTNYGISAGAGEVNARVIAVAPDARATYTANNSDRVAELQADVDDLIAALAQHREMLIDPAGLIESARAVRTEIAVAHPDPGRICQLINRIGCGVTRAASLTTAVAELQYAIGRLV